MKTNVRSLSSLGLKPIRRAVPVIETVPTPAVTTASIREHAHKGFLHSLRDEALKRLGVGTNFLVSLRLGEFMEDAVAGAGFSIRDEEPGLADGDDRDVTGFYDAEQETARPVISLEPGPDGAPVVTVTPLPEEPSLGRLLGEARHEAIQTWRDHWDDGLDVSMVPSAWCFSAENPVLEDLCVLADEKRSAGGFSDAGPDEVAEFLAKPVGYQADLRPMSEWADWRLYLQRGAEQRISLFAKLANWLHDSSAATIRREWSKIRSRVRAGVSRAVPRDLKVGKKLADWTGLVLTGAQMKALEAYRRVMLNLRDAKVELPELRWTPSDRCTPVRPETLRRPGCAKADALPSASPQTFTPPTTKRRVNLSASGVRTVRRAAISFRAADHDTPPGAANAVSILARRETHLFRVKLDQAVRWLPLQAADVDAAAHIRDYYRRITATCATPHQALALTMREEAEYADLDRPNTDD